VSFSESDEVLFVGVVNAGSWAISRAMEGLVRTVIPRPPQNDCDVKTQKFSSSVVSGKHVGAVVHGSLVGSKAAEETLCCKMSSCW